MLSGKIIYSDLHSRSGTQLDGDLSSILAIHPKSIVLQHKPTA